MAVLTLAGVMLSMLAISLLSIAQFEVGTHFQILVGKLAAEHSQPGKKYWVYLFKMDLKGIPAIVDIQVVGYPALQPP